MIEAYLDAAIRQARERAKLLKTKIPQPVMAAELTALQLLCESSIDNIIDSLDYLLTDRTILMKELAKERIRMYRRNLGVLSGLETSGIAALSRIHRDDIFLNKLVFEIHQEIHYPLTPPTVTSLSRDYFSINTALHLLELPLAESDFLLHLPDIYHEIGHLLIATMNNPKVEPFQQELGKFLLLVSQHFESEHIANRRATGPTTHFAHVLDLLERSWIDWANEIFCDLFAVYTIGPAYAWAHFHLTAGTEGDPFKVHLGSIMSHPPDQGRTEAILIGLQLIGLQEQATRIQQAWDALVKATGAIQTPMYRKACPHPLIEQAAIHALEGTKKIGCRIVTENTSNRVHDLLNMAWDKFWANPANYHEWERDIMNQLKEHKVGV